MATEAGMALTGLVVLAILMCCAFVGWRFCRQVKNIKTYNLAAIEVNMGDKCDPTVVTAPTITTAISIPIKAYSIAVTPESSLIYEYKKFMSIAFILC